MVRMHRVRRLRIRTENGMHERGTRRTRVSRMTEELANDEEEERACLR